MGSVLPLWQCGEALQSARQLRLSTTARSACTPCRTRDESWLCATLATRALLETRPSSPAWHRAVSGARAIPQLEQPTGKPCAGNRHARFERGSCYHPSYDGKELDLPMQTAGLLKDGYLVGRAVVRVLGDSTK